MPPGRGRARARARIARCRRASRSGRPGGLRQRASGTGGERAEVGARRVDQHAVEGRSARRRRSHPRCGRRRWRPCGLAVRRRRVGAARVVLHGDERAAVLHQRREMGRLAARRGAEVEHALAGPRRERTGDGHRGPRLRHEPALGPQRRVEGVERRVEHEPLGQAGCGMRRDVEPLRELLRGRLERVRAQDGLGGLVERGHQGAGLLGAERAEPQPGDPARIGVAERGLGGRGARAGPRPSPRPSAPRAGARR